MPSANREITILTDAILAALVDFATRNDICADAQIPNLRERLRPGARVVATQLALHLFMP